MKFTLWDLGNVWGYLFGFSGLAPFHHAMVNLGLHGLGYDNMFFDSWTGEERFIKRILSPTNPRVCIDVGANVGNYTRLLLKHTDSKIYAIEPSQTAFAHLSKIKDERLTIINTAIADYEGTATLFSKGDADGSASLDPTVRVGSPETVRVQRLENIAPQETDFVKIDVEGYELEVLRGLAPMRPRFVQFEFNWHHLRRGHTLYEITKLLPDYMFYRLLPHGWIKINPEKYVNNIFKFSNIVAVRAGQ